MGDQQKWFNAIENVLRDAEDRGYHEPMGAYMFFTFEEADETDKNVKWQYSTMGWSLLKELVLRNEHIGFLRRKLIKRPRVSTGSGEFSHDWEEDESESDDTWVETKEVMRRLADEDYWIA